VFFLEDFGYNIKLIVDFGINFEIYFEAFDREDPSTLEELLRAKLISQGKGSTFKNLYSKHFIFNHKRKGIDKK